MKKPRSDKDAAAAASGVTDAATKGAAAAAPGVTAAAAPGAHEATNGAATPNDYAASGVNRAEGYKTVAMIRSLVGAHSADAADEIGSFAALHPIPGVEDLLLGAATDGVGTKIELAVRYDRLADAGQDCVAMCINDLACHGVRPLFFLDYVACETLNAKTAAALVGGIADAVDRCGAKLIGGETAEMPGIYTDGSYDVAGFAVGTVRRDRVIRRSLITGTEALLAVPSSGVHSNGFSLVRRVIPDMDELFNGAPIHEALLTPTRLYAPEVIELLGSPSAAAVRGIAHITGGGLYENVPRILPGHYDAVIDRSAIIVPPIFERIAAAGIDGDEMFRTFNMGVGLVLAVAADAVDAVTEVIPDAYPIGHITPGEGVLHLR